MSTNDNLAGAAHDWLAHVRDQVGSIRYGEIRITVHERKVTQVERTEKVRFDTPEARSNRAKDER